MRFTAQSCHRTGGGGASRPRFGRRSVEFIGPLVDLALERRRTALHVVKLKRPGDALPKILVADGDEFAEPFPSPFTFAPLAQTLTNSAAYVAAAGQQRDARGLIECFQGANHCEQLEPIPTGARLLIRSDE